MWIAGRRRLRLRHGLLLLFVLGGMAYVTVFTDRYALTAVLIEAPAAARLTIDGRPMEWCKHERHGGVGCSKEPHGGVRLYQWQLRPSMQAPLQVTHQGKQETFQITAPDEPAPIGYRIVMESGELVFYEVDL